MCAKWVAKEALPFETETESETEEKSCLGKLANAQQASARCNLITVAAANLSSCKRQLASIVVEQVTEVYEDTLHIPRHWTCVTCRQASLCS